MTSTQPQPHPGLRRGGRRGRRARDRQAGGLADLGRPLNVLLKAPEVAYCLGDAQARALVTWAGGRGGGAEGAADAGVPAVYVVNTPGVPEMSARFEELLAVEPETRPLKQTDPGDTAVIVYTSGTTGAPKGAS